MPVLGALAGQRLPVLDAAPEEMARYGIADIPAYLAAISAFAVPRPDRRPPRSDLAAHRVRAVGRWSGSNAPELPVQHHRSVADEVEPLPGADRGPIGNQRGRPPGFQFTGEGLYVGAADREQQCRRRVKSSAAVDIIHAQANTSLDLY